MGAAALFPFWLRFDAKLPEESHLLNILQHFPVHSWTKVGGVHHVARLTALLTVTLIPSAATAASWFFQPGFTVGAGYEENADLEEQNPINTSRYDVDLFARGGWLSERLQTVGYLRAFSRRYPGNETLDSDNLSASLDFGVLATERDRLSLGLRFDRDTSRLSELTTTGNITENVPRNAVAVRPEWQRQLTERSVMGIAYEYTQVRFDSNTSGLVDYDQDDIDAYYGYQLTERLGFRGTISLVLYEPDNDESYEGYDATLGLNYAFSETLVGNLFLGPQWITSQTDFEAETEEKTESGLLYGFDLSKQLDRSGIVFSLRRGAVPTGSGEPLLQESLSVDYSYRFSPLVSLSLPLEVFRNEQYAFGDAAADADTRLFWSTEPTLTWRLTEDLILRASYRYQYQRYENAGDAADGNAFFLSLSYVLPTELSASSR